MEEGEERDRFVELITVQMKKNYIAWNKDGVEDKKIFEDLRHYSQGRIDITEGEIRINPGAPAGGQRNGKGRQWAKDIQTQILRNRINHTRYGIIHY